MFRALLTVGILLLSNLAEYPFHTNISYFQNGVDEPLEIIGSFDNLKFTEDHAYGYRLKIWRQGNQVMGLFMSYQGMAADPPTGLLEDVTFDPKTRKLGFRTRLTTGLTYSQQYNGVPSQDIFQFDGFLRNGRIEGNLEVSNALFPDKEPKGEKIVIKKSKEGTADMETFSSYAEWKQRVDETLKRLGPKW